MYLRANTPLTTPEIIQIVGLLARVPFGTITPNNPLTRSSDIIVTYRNYDHLDRWGSDLAAEVSLDARDRFRLTGAYSWTNKDVFTNPNSTSGLANLALNAPHSRGSLGVRLTGEHGLSASLRGRYVTEFPMASGAYNGRVDAYAVVDATVGYHFQRPAHPQLVITADNLFDRRHQEFIGAPYMGRLVMATLRVGI